MGANVSQNTSQMRKTYIVKLIARCIVFALCAVMLLTCPEETEILSGMNFFQRFSGMHLLWMLWVLDVIGQLFPTKNLPLGSQKLFVSRYRPTKQKLNYEKLRNYVIGTTKSAYKVFLIWGILLSAIGILYYNGVLSNASLFMISVAFYVCDLICVLIWCPFRLLMKNRCCTTCRIFNWDHMMMFTPMMFIDGFYSRSLLALALAAWILWEYSVVVYPERFWEMTNTALQCSSCTDKLCTQFCKKLRK